MVMEIVDTQFFFSLLFGLLDVDVWHFWWDLVLRKHGLTIKIFKQSLEMIFSLIDQCIAWIMWKNFEGKRIFIKVDIFQSSM